jgi:hypothetical protein
MFFASYRGEDGEPRWSRRFGHVEPDSTSWADIVWEHVTDVAVSPVLGTVNLIGAFEGEIDFGGGLLDASGADMFLASYAASDGSHRWSRSFGGRAPASETVGRNIVTTHDGEIRFLASINSAASLGGDELIVPETESFFVSWPVVAGFTP